MPARLSPEEVRRRTRLVLGTGLLGVATYGARSGWADDLTTSFGTRSEGWFGKRTYAGGADKLGHAFAGYAGTRLLTRSLEWAGNPPDKALRLGALATLGVLLGVEVLDGFEENHSFSWEDQIANIAGVGLGVLLERRPDLDALMDYRVQYWPADAWRRAGKIPAVDGDYDGYSYLVALKASGIPALRKRHWLRYLELTVGYGTYGFGAVNGVDQYGTRHLYYGLSLNLSELLGATVFRDTPKTATAPRIAEGMLEYVQVPGTALLADHAPER